MKTLLMIVCIISCVIGAMAQDSGNKIIGTKKSDLVSGKKVITNFPAISKLSGTEHCVVLVPIQGCDKWLIATMQNELSSTLGIPVFVQTIDVKYPEASRNAYNRAIAQLRAQIKSLLKNNPMVVMLMNQYGYKEEDIESDEKLIQIAKKAIAIQDPAAAGKLADEIERLKQEDSQWDVKILKAVLFNAVKPYKRDNVVYIAITPVDIYADDKKFVLGSADSFGGVVSYYRLTSGFTKDTPKKDKLAKRTKMQCLASLGDAVGKTVVIIQRVLDNIPLTLQNMMLRVENRVVNAVSPSKRFLIPNDTG
ncbi:MAG: hypothetical protein PF692_14530 [Kiritimatiellae bacterium]|jgi:hypothetical protein|nr:hypothetical protein [Kiritimatiellia bacterium]